MIPFDKLRQLHAAVGNVHFKPIEAIEANKELGELIFVHLPELLNLAEKALQPQGVSTLIKDWQDVRYRDPK